MSSQHQPIQVYGQGGPNPPKVAILCNELSIPYEINQVPFSDVKKPAYLAINPNGRLPAIQDPNTNLTLWESGAIFEYLIERYDTNHKLSFPAGSDEAQLARQWLFFQTSGQGPYYGQLSFFKKFHSEKIPSVIERFAKEVNRVTSVLEGWLVKQKEEFGAANDGPWLVGGKLSYADLAFVPWQRVMTMVFLEKEEYNANDYPEVTAWMGRMLEREGVKKVFENQPQPTK